MEMKTSTIFEKNLLAYDAGKRLIINQGGTSSTKTFSILQLVTIIAEYAKEKTLTSIISESIPHLKRGVIRDFRVIMGDRYDDTHYNATDRIYRLGKSEIEFFSADDSRKLRGGRRNNLFCNEVNNISKLSFDEADTRTSGTVWVDYNPSEEFWIEQYKTLPSSEYIHSTYKDGLEFLDPETVRKIELRKETDPNWWRVYGEGLTGNITGRVHPNMDLIDEYQDGPCFFGLDFGFSGDPTAFVKCMLRNTLHGPQELICDELVYETGLTDQDFVERLKQLNLKKNYDEIFADPSQPKAIEVIRRAGYNIKPASNAILFGVNKVNEYKHKWTKRSLNGIKEQRNYHWIQDKNGQLTQKLSGLDHLMDARRYAVVGKGDIQTVTATRMRF